MSSISDLSAAFTIDDIENHWYLIRLNEFVAIIIRDPYFVLSTSQPKLVRVPFLFKYESARFIEKEPNRQRRLGQFETSGVYRKLRLIWIKHRRHYLHFRYRCERCCCFCRWLLLWCAPCNYFIHSLCSIVRIRHRQRALNRKLQTMVKTTRFL